MGFRYSAGKAMYYLYQRFERTTLISVWSVAALGGIAIANVWPLFGGIWLMFGVVVLPAAWRRTWAAVGAVLISGLLIGVWRGSLEQQRLSELSMYVGHQVQIEGRVAADPEVAAARQLQNLRLESLTVNGMSQTGAVNLQIPTSYDGIPRRCRRSGRDATGWLWRLSGKNELSEKGEDSSDSSARSQAA